MEKTNLTKMYAKGMWQPFLYCFLQNDKRNVACLYGKSAEIAERAANGIKIALRLMGVNLFVCQVATEVYIVKDRYIQEEIKRRRNECEDVKSETET